MTRTYGQGTYGQGTYGGSPLDGVARVAVVVGAAAGPLDVSCDWRSLSTAAGRSSYLDAFTAGTCRVELYNPTGRYSPWPPDSIWKVAGYVTSTPIAVGVVIDGARFPLFTGSTDALADSWPSFIDSVVTVDATDGMKGLARFRSTSAAVPPVELTGARVGRLLDLAAWSAPRRLDAGTLTVASQDPKSAALADLLRQVDEAEWGAWYVAADGAAVFRQRDFITTDPRLNTVQAWFVDEHDAARPDAVCYSDLKLVAADDRIVNLAVIQRPSKPDVSATDAASTAHFGARTLTLSGSLVVDDVQTAALAQFIVLLEAADDLRVESITFDADDAAVAAVAADLRLLDRIGLVRHFPGGYVLETELLVEGIRHDLAPLGDDRQIGRWTVTLSTASALTIKAFAMWDEDVWDEDEWGV